MPEIYDRILLAALNAAQAKYPGRRVAAVRIQFQDGGELALPVPDRLQQQPGPVEVEENELVQMVLDCIGENVLTGPEIAARLGVESTPYFRSFLSSMRKSGLLGGDTKQRGYTVARRIGLLAAG